MLTFDTDFHRATIYSLTSQDEWLELCERLRTGHVEEVYFHYTNYYQYNSDLLSALASAPNLKSVLLKGSTFHFSNSKTIGCGLTSLFEGLESCPKLEHIQIRNFSSDELDIAFQSLVHLIEKKSHFKKLTIWHQEINGTEFKLLCDLLARPGVQIELDLQFDIKLSTENKMLLKEAMQANKSLRVSHNLEFLLSDVVDVPKTAEFTRSLSWENNALPPCCVKTKNDIPPGIALGNERDSYISMQILNGFIAVLGVAALAVAFTALNAASMGIPGLAVAAAGVASILTGIGLFAANHFKSSEVSQDISNEVQPAF